jgi:CRISPR/Cas system CMR-associated protein Cmr3 (group 5 of RAMP superfamily)
MRMLRFNDGINIDTSGELRVIHLTDGYYVVGHGMSIPVDSAEDGEKAIREIREKKGENPNHDDA